MVIEQFTEKPSNNKKKPGRAPLLHYCAKEHTVQWRRICLANWACMRDLKRIFFCKLVTLKTKNIRETTHRQKILKLMSKEPFFLNTMQNNRAHLGFAWPLCIMFFFAHKHIVFKNTTNF